MKTKLYDQLGALERQFQQDLVVALPDVVAGHDSLLFDSSDYSDLDDEYQNSDLSQVNQLMSVADEIMRLRDRLGESVDNSLTLRFQTACRDYSDTSNHHRLGAQTLLNPYWTTSVHPGVFFCMSEVAATAFYAASRPRKTVPELLCGFPASPLRSQRFVSCASIPAQLNSSSRN